MADIVHPRDPGIELIEAADGLVFAAIDRRLARGFGAGCGERDRREASRLKFRSRRRALAAGSVVCVPRGAAEGDRCAGARCVAMFVDLLRQRSGANAPPLLLPASASTSAGSICEYSATRRVSVENSIAFRNAISLRASGSCTASSSSGTSSSTLSSSSTSCREIRAFSAFSISASRRFGCLISPARGEQRFQIAIFDDQLRGGLDADAGHARHVVGGIAGQRLHLDHLFRRHAELLDHFGNADAAVLHGVVHGDAVGHELHQVLVGGDDGRGGAALRRPSRA